MITRQKRRNRSLIWANILTRQSESNFKVAERQAASSKGNFIIISYLWIFFRLLMINFQLWSAAKPGNWLDIWAAAWFGWSVSAEHWVTWSRSRRLPRYIRRSHLATRRNGRDSQPFYSSVKKKFQNFLEEITDKNTVSLSFTLPVRIFSLKLSNK